MALSVVYIMRFALKENPHGLMADFVCKSVSDVPEKMIEKFIITRFIRKKNKDCYVLSLCVKSV